MNKAHIKLLKENYEKACNEILKAFCCQYELQYEKDAWVAGEELKQDWFNIYQAAYRIKFRETIEGFFRSFQRSDYGAGGSLDSLISKTNSSYAAVKPQSYLR
jgi:hypothetical protein